MAFSISLAEESDVDLLYELTVALAVYEKKTPDEIFVTAAKLRKWGFGPKKVFSALVARLDDKPVGLAVYYFGFSGYMGEPILYLEDLFILPEFRKRGFGGQMLKHLSQMAFDQECCRVQWAVFDWNEDAIAFYRSIGAQLRPDLIQVRLDSSQPPTSTTNA
ncbi:MAG: GNAT family N-acetyltransferase [Candidatus Obscuribacterales bacterium]|nr:GNAT family N-acetyltransferase [Candidatus Obscuribacterales bacterium]